MGAADVVPGVSGGTIAFITGVYEELLDSIKSVNITSIKVLFKEGPISFWKAVNGNFLLALLTGIIISVVSLARVLKYILAEHPVLIWSFFFGLIVASAVLIAKKITKWSIPTIISVSVGVAIAYYITVVSPSETPEAYWFIFLSGALAICAMILPGISGSFILLLLGKYEFVLNAISDFKISVIATFAVGAGVGLLSFSNLLSWLLKKHHDLTVALLSGFMIGSLNKVWPWKETISTFVNRKGEVKPLFEKNILPDTFQQITNQDPQMMYAIALAAVGALVIFVVDKYTKSE